jgi:hypothetical protein
VLQRCFSLRGAAAVMRSFAAIVVSFIFGLGDPARHRNTIRPMFGLEAREHTGTRERRADEAVVEETGEKMRRES